MGREGDGVMNGDQRLQAGTNKMRRKLVCLELADWHVKMSPDKNQGRRAHEMCRWLACACSHALSVRTYVCDSRLEGRLGDLIMDDNLYQSLHAACSSKSLVLLPQDDLCAAAHQPKTPRC